MAFGNGDLATQLGVSLDDWTALLHARSAVVLASAAARLPAPIDGPTTSLRHPELAATQARWAAALGFGGKLCIHPQQVTAVQAAFTPSPRQVEWATRIVKFDGHGAVEVDGEMVDAPIVTRARAILSRVPPRACPR
jgi:citrate lyase subunit beta/citryl-CoA lyase